MCNESHELRFGVVHADGDTTIMLGGDLDLASATELAARLESVIDASAGTITVDLARVTFLDSTGLVTILAAQERMTEAGRRLEVCNPSRSVHRVLELSGASRILDVGLPAMDAVAD